MLIRRAAIAVALALATTWVLAPGAQAAAPADGPFYTCSESPTATAAYTSVGGALIWLQSWGAARADGSAAATTPTSCSAAPDVPPDGAIAESVAGGAATAKYVVVGGAPLRITDWSAIGLSGEPADVSYFDAASLPPVTGSEIVNTGPPWNYDLASHFNVVARNGYFRSLNGTYYRTDAAGHPLVLPGKSAAHPTPPVVDQASINTCDRMNCSPWGDISVQVVGEGQIRVSGYALDAMNTAPLTVHLDAAGQSYDIVADQPDPSINSGYGISGNFGFDRVLTVPAGHYDLCTTFLGYAPGGTSTQAGCQVLDVPGSVPKRVARPKLKAPGHGKLVVRWKPAVTQGSAISEYIVKVSGGGTKQVSGIKHSVVFKHLRPGKTVTAKVRAINGVGAGKYSKASKKVRVR